VPGLEDIDADVEDALERVLHLRPALGARS
jgi:hypothetical protein